jgi:hypothetical protein
MMRCRITWIAAAVALAVVIASVTVIQRKPTPRLLDVRFLQYTNNTGGAFSAVLEIKNTSDFRIARNSVRISRDPGPLYADVEWPWYLADVRSRVLEPSEAEALVITFDQHNPMVRWQATAIYVWNPTALEDHFKRCVDWLKDRRLAPAYFQDKSDRLCRGESSTEWMSLKSSESAPNQSDPPNDGPAFPVDNSDATGGGRHR